MLCPSTHLSTHQCAHPSANPKRSALNTTTSTEHLSDNSAKNSASSTVEELAALLQQHGYTVTTAESCTGGLVAAEITSVAGSSAFFKTGVVSYSNDTKRRVLDVAARTLADHGAVSEEVVTQMAEGARKRDNADVSIAISGVAGPDGGTAEKPVGMVWISWSVLVQNRHEIDAECFNFKGNRKAVRESAVEAALRGTIARLAAVNVS